jgi:hydrogenase expression/formation protein HypC
MCLAVPMKVKEIEGGVAVAEFKGVEKRVSTLLIEDLKKDDFILVHAGFAISRVDPDEAEKTLSLMDEILQGEEVFE